MRKKALLSITLCFMMSVIFSSTGFSAFQDDVIVMDKRRVVKTYDFKKDGNLYVKSVTGDIEINSWNKDKIEVEITKRGRRDDVEVYIDNRNGRMTIEVEYPNQRRNRYRQYNTSASLHFDIKVPENIELEMKSATGSIFTSNIKGSVEAETSTGGVEVENVTGDVYAKSATGSVELYNITGDVEARSSTGHVEIGKSSCKNIEASSSTGSVDVETDVVDERGEIDLRSSTGSITLAIPGTAKADITAKVRPRSLSSDFDIFDEDEKRRSKRKRNNRYVYSYSFDFSPRTYRGELNGGGCRINLSVSMGRIDIREK